MKRQGKTIAFESEKEAAQALADLEFVKGVREEREKTRLMFARWNDAEIAAMNHEIHEELPEGWL